MKFKQILILFIVFIFCSIYSVNTTKGELFQLKSIHSVTEEDKVKKHTTQELLEKEKGKIFVINFLKAPFNEKYSMTTDKYKKIFKNVDSLKRVFDKESYTKIDFIKIDLIDSSEQESPHITIKANVYWFMEGYDGITTFYFMLVKIKDEWFLDWLIF